MGEFTGQTAIITGASRGIGAAAARRLAEAGAAVLLLARSGEEIASVADEIKAAGGRAEAFPCDVASYEAVEAAVAHGVAAFGGLDILVNNAGVIAPVARLADTDPTAWSDAFDINLKGVYHGVRAALPVMLARGRGVIVNISSGAATNPLEGWSHYCASKAGALMLTRMIDKEYAASGIRAVGLSPGTVATEMQRVIKTSGVNPVSRLAWEDHISPEDVAEAIRYLCGDAAADLAGTDFSLKTPEGRARVGLAPR